MHAVTRALIVVAVAVLGGFPAAAQTARTPETRTFVDAPYGYSIQVPATWRLPTTQAAAQAKLRLDIITPAQNRFLVVIDELPILVTRSSTFDIIGQRYVDPILQRYMRALKLLDGARQTGDRSTQDSLRFWQGTATMSESGGAATVLSLHAIRFGTRVMVTLMYLSGHTSLPESRQVDQIMDTLSLTAPRS